MMDVKINIENSIQKFRRLRDDARQNQIVAEKLSFFAQVEEEKTRVAIYNEIICSLEDLLILLIKEYS